MFTCKNVQLLIMNECCYFRNQIFEKVHVKHVISILTSWTRNVFIDMKDNKIFQEEKRRKFCINFPFPFSSFMLTKFEILKGFSED